MPSHTKVVIVFLKNYVNLNFSSGRFESYDYGPANFDHYGQKLPITYDLSKVLALQCFPRTCGSFWPFFEIFDHYYQLPLICWRNLLINILLGDCSNGHFQRRCGQFDRFGRYQQIGKMQGSLLSTIKCWHLSAKENIKFVEYICICISHPCCQVNNIVQVSELPNVVLDHLVEVEGWSHMDYIGTPQSP